MKQISLILLITGLLTLHRCSQQTDNIIYDKPEVQPYFKYDTCINLKNSVKKYFNDNYKIPQILLDNEYAGSIYIEFVIEKDSTISNVKLIRGIDNPLNKSVIETIKAMPKWYPGRNKGKPVRTRFILPVSIHWLYGETNN